MITCDICFDDNLKEENIHYMECLHYLCDNCFEKLKVNTCPFCRLEIYLKSETLYEIPRKNRSEIRRNKKERKRRLLLKFLEEE